MVRAFLASLLASTCFSPGSIPLPSSFLAFGSSDSPTNNKPTSVKIGADAEKQAEIFLQNEGLTVITKNYACRFGEIDLIMRDRNTLVFVEVRLRKYQQWGSGAQSVHYYKQQKVITTARHFLQANRRLARLANRFDVVSVQMDPENAMQFNWIKNAFDFTEKTR